jgi:hypothetical protein
MSLSKVDFDTVILHSGSYFQFLLIAILDTSATSLHEPPHTVCSFREVGEQQQDDRNLRTCVCLSVTLHIVFNGYNR